MRPFLVLFCFAVSAFAQPAATPQKPPEPSEEGIPVTDTMVRQKCGGCHQKDAKGNLTRISWERTTPEGWQEIIKRMVRLNGLTLKPEEARHIVRYLSANHGLAPEEAKPVLYYAEHRSDDEKPPSDVVRDTCGACHKVAVPMQFRRSKDEWDLLVSMHIAFFPVTEWMSFRRWQRPNAEPPAPGADIRHPVDRAVEYFGKAQPLHTPEWSDWQASMRAPKLSGRWLVMARQTGKGRWFGEMVVEPGAAEGDFTSRVQLKNSRDGSMIQRAGKSVVYTGYAWRGRSEPSGNDGIKQIREVMMVSRDQASMEGRWFWGGYEEFGLDVKLVRAGSGPQVLGTDIFSLRSGTTGNTVHIFGDNLPQGLAAADIDLGNGVKVKKLVSAAANEVAVEVDVDAAAIPGKRDVAIRQATLPGTIAVYDKIDYLKVLPEPALAHLGGNTHPKGLVQFEAVAFHRGADGKANTADDINLGPVEVKWSVEEFYATIGDDDKEFVGTLDAKGLFTPSSEGPNPKRKWSRNNFGDVWVVATFTGDPAIVRDDIARDKSKPLSGRSYLVVTVPQYMRWDQPEVAE